MAKETTLKIEGLRELRRELNRYGVEANKTVKVAHREIGKMIVDGAVEAARSAPKSRGAGKSNKYASVYAATLKSAPTVKAARAASRLPWAHGAEFGAKSKRQFGPWSGNQFMGGEPGHVAYAGIRKNFDEIKERYVEAIMDAFAKAYPHRG